MKTRIIFCMLLLLTVSVASAQRKFYIDREALASPKLKTTLQNARAVIKAKNYRFEVGNTTVSETNAAQLTGYKLPDAATLNKYASYIRANSNKVYDYKLPQALTGASSFDLRDYHLVTPIRAQACGNCWTYGITAAMESNFLMNNHKDTYAANDPISPANLNFSEAQALSCSAAGDCTGGWMSGVAYYYANTKSNISNEAENPDQGWSTPACATLNSAANKYQVVDWGFIANTTDNWVLPTVVQIKDAIIKHGAVTVAFIAKGTDFDNFFTNYTDGVYDLPFPKSLWESNPGACIFHAVTIIGWNNTTNAWLIKNSWGPGWGNQGYGWIGWTSSLIGLGATWVETKSIIDLKINPNLFKVKPRIIFKEEVMDPKINPLLKMEMIKVKPVKPVIIRQ